MRENASLFVFLATSTENPSLRAQRSNPDTIKRPAVYIMASQRNGTLYTGVTSDLIQRVHQHKTGTTGFTARHGCKTLVWYEQHETMESAIACEKRTKSGSRKAKLNLIELTNPTPRDLYPDLL